MFVFSCLLVNLNRTGKGCKLKHHEQWNTISVHYSDHDLLALVVTSDSAIQMCSLHSFRFHWGNLKQPVNRSGVEKSTKSSFMCAPSENHAGETPRKFHNQLLKLITCSLPIPLMISLQFTQQQWKIFIFLSSDCDSHLNGKWILFFIPFTHSQLYWFGGSYVDAWHISIVKCHCGTVRLSYRVDVIAIG